mgnify:CR=1 FL=1
MWDDWEAAPRGSKTVYGRVGIWLGANGHIHVRLGGGDGQISTIAPNAASERGNPHLYRKLRSILQEKGRWSE